MASILRQIVAGPRAPHPEAGLDLCYVTDRIIATSGPSGTYPQRAYRNPLSSLVKFLDYKHTTNWAIWEFRAEGTGYPDEDVYGRVWHYPWPDHHPPPFALIPNIMASMRNWLHESADRVVVVHCKAGKGRSGTVSCAYLVSEEGWAVEDAIARFTERRMRPGFGAGVSIPSQLRWLSYVDRWTKGGKRYVERQVEIVEVKVWGLRDGVKITVEGFVDDGKLIKNFHVFGLEEREVTRGKLKDGTGFAGVVADVMGRSNSVKKKASPSNPAAELQKSTSATASLSNTTTTTTPDPSATAEYIGADATFTPTTPVVLPTNDINIDFERRSTAAYGLTMVTAVAHVWLNAFFEGHGSEQAGRADPEGVFALDWDKMDGIKGSSRKGAQAFDRFEVRWKVHDLGGEVVIDEPAVGEEVGQAAPADWHGNAQAGEENEKDLGIRTTSPTGREGTGSTTTMKKENNMIVSVPQTGSTGSDGTKAHGVVADVAGESTHGDGDGDGHGHGHGHDHVSTTDLPGGRPEAEMKTAKEHSLGHLGREKK
ncbi:phosphatases II [Pseudovirgaria hyperparasitica]|uniref:phosphatidylinositol-3,4,5-trisphosphate 3-phosphatase n=1 Tax=Pseudovirgaria hyperparasitica TaxID=470096 RepID=A0A6A6WJY0_9PEZI|nr:phosphatases II [Pseudovirgaria hyperparasitica]KAF2762347.1 phosphatases II [Pseudovirgaria hyperparasitica]